MKQLLLFLALIAALPARAGSAPLSFRSAANQTALLELYTSEGCDSCPPAEDWLSGLRESPGLWTGFVPLAFHVDYWDSLGWRDSWSSNAFSARQRDYAEDWRSQTIYTPEFVLNGGEWRDWAGSKDGPKSASKKAGVLAVSSLDTNRWNISFAPAKTNRVNYEAHAALLGGGLSSNVRAGENQGRVLKHDFVVLSVVDKPLTHTGDKVGGDLVLDARRNLAPDGTLAIAVWITEIGHLEPEQAAGAWLVRPTSGR